MFDRILRGAFGMVCGLALGLLVMGPMVLVANHCAPERPTTVSGHRAATVAPVGREWPYGASLDSDVAELYFASE